MDDYNCLLESPSNDGEQKTEHKFSPTAAPFTPKNITSGILMPLEDTTLSTSALSVNAPEFYPKNFASYSKPAEYSIVLKVRQTIAELTVNPADFDQVMHPLSDLFAMSVHEESTLAAIVEEIFVQSMREANFRYTGARMCSCLSEHLQLESGASFQSYLINRCLAEFDYQYQFSGENLSAIIELALFLSELMVNMKDLETGQVISHFPQQITQLIFTMLGRYSHTEIAMHCVVQVLKLTGAVLEEHVACFDELFAQIRALILDPRTSQNMRAMLVCLIELRAGNWGRNESDRTIGAGDSMTDTSGNEHQTPEQVYMSLLADENNDSPGVPEPCWSGTVNGVSSSALQESASSGAKSEYWAGDQSMDAETAAAYEMFIAESRSRPTVNRNTSRNSNTSAAYQYKGNWVHHS